MRKPIIAAIIVLLLGVFAAAEPMFEKEHAQAGRLLTGKVLDQQDNPVRGAVVYLSNTRTQAVKTYIAGEDGSYRFPALSPNVDYEVYAQYKGQKSDTKMLSQFDSRPQVNINLKIDSK